MNDVSKIEGETQLPAVRQINTGNLLDQLMTLAASNMAGDGKYTDKQINNQAKLVGVAIRVCELELKINKSFRG